MLLLGKLHYHICNFARRKKTMESLIQYIKQTIAITADDEQVIRSMFERRELDKDVYLLDQGRICRNMYFVEKGILHTYYEHEGKDVSSWFYDEDNFVTSWYSFLMQAPSFEYIQTLEPSIIHSISHFNLQELYRLIPAFEKFGRILSETQFSYMESFNKGYMFLSAKEKYELLCQHIPNITLRVKLGLIATFLGISQETLSRIRASK